LAGYPTGNLLPIRRDLSGVFLQTLAVGTYGYVELGKFHGAVKVSSHVDERYQCEWFCKSEGRSLIASLSVLSLGIED
jgi:hypothetical protein